MIDTTIRNITTLFPVNAAVLKLVHEFHQHRSIIQDLVLILKRVVFPVLHVVEVFIIEYSEHTYTLVSIDDE
jgi:hypothetical protein